MVMVSTGADSTATPPGLPHETTSFVGRRRERTEIRRLLSESRLVTLAGFGGVGKTRLALRTAADLRRAFADGVYVVSLAPIGDSTLLAQAVATALGLQARAQRAAPESLADYVRDKEVLLVLDNCEHMIDAVAELADTLLHRCARLRILATSREPLRIDGETIHAVSPLGIPPKDSSGPSSGLHAFEAVDLFVDRAKAVRPDFELTETNSSAVAEICTKLEGIPLAIELAAVRLRTMSPVELASNLTGRWEILTRGSRTAPNRQRTMAACIEWSYELCTEAERDLWAAVAVFSDGFTLDAAEAVCRGVAAEEPLPDVIASLVEKSVITAQTHDAQTRFRLLPPIRHRGLRRLEESGHLTELRRRHRDWYVDLARRTHENWVGPSQGEWIRTMRRETGNIQAALGFCFTEPGEAAPGLQMGADLHEFGLAEGLFHYGLMWFKRLLPLAPEPTVTRALALRTACWWSASSGDIASSLRLLVEGQQVADEVGGALENLYTQTAGFVALFSGDTERAIELLDEALGLFRDEGNTAEEAQTLYLLQLSHVFAGNFEQAMTSYEQCRAITEPVGEGWARGYSTWIAGFTRWSAGDSVAAVKLYQRALEISRQINDPVGIGLGFEGLGWVAVGKDPERAAVLLGAAASIWDRIETSTSALRGLFVHHQGAVDAAGEALGEQASDEAAARGRSLGIPEAVRYALGETPKRKPPTPAGRTRTHDTAGVLTKRETEIATLVAQGVTNKDIAERLVISKRTAETHVENILTKLGFTSRNQITVWMADQVDPVGAAAERS